MRQSPLPIFALALVLAGCGGRSSHHSSSSSSTATLKGGVSNLNAALTSDTNRTESLRSAQRAFDAAYLKNPGDPRLALGYGVSTAALAADALGETILARATPRKSLLGGFGSRLGVGSRARLLSKGQSLSDLNDLRVQLQTVVARLTPARIDALEANPLALSYGDGGVQVSLGTVEGYALRSAVEAALGEIDFKLAYGLATSEDLDASFATTYAAPIAAGTVLAPADYLPGGEFGKRQPGAAALLAEASTVLNGTADDGNAALARLATRTPAGWVTDLFAVDAAQKASIKTDLDTLKATLNGGSTYTVSGASVAVNLGAFLANGSADLRAFYPSLAPSSGMLTPVAGSVADPTYGGLVPSGVPSDALYGGTISFDAATTRQEVNDAALPLSSLLPF